MTTSTVRIGGGSGATLSAFASFHKNERQNRLHNESTDMARIAMERMTAQLRNLAAGGVRLRGGL